MRKASDFIKSFIYASRGLRQVFKEERNFRVDTIIALIIFVSALLGGFSSVEQALLMFAATFVLVVELINSIVERAADIVEPRLHERVREVKDAMAGATLLAALGATAVGLIIIIPKIF